MTGTVPLGRSTAAKQPAPRRFNLVALHLRSLASASRHRRGLKRLHVVAKDQSLETDFGTSGGRAGAAQLREEPASTSQPPLGAAAAAKQQGDEMLSESADYLRDELRHIFSSGVRRNLYCEEVTRQRYAEDISFQDPVARYRGRSAYVANIQLLRSAFDIDFTVHSIKVQEPDGIKVRWTMVLKPKFVPWRPQLTLTGRSQYTVNTSTGQITLHTDTWDALSDNSYLSLEGLALVIRSLTNPQTTPSLETPKYTVLRKTGDYEIRRYEPYMVAEVAMPAGSGPAAGEGFNDLAGYIFGGNNRGASMEMTTPVYSTAGQTGLESGRMQFVMEERYGRDEAALPTPNSAKVRRRLEGEKTVAAHIFSGWPLDWEVHDAERRLRGALLLDGLESEQGYHLARYNDPFTLPFLRRNEVLVRLPAESFEP